MPSARNHCALGDAPTSRNKRRERDAGPLAGARQAVDLLRRHVGGVAFATIRAAAVAGALHEMDHRASREAPQIGQRQDQRALDHPVNQQRIGRRVDGGHAAVMALEVQIGGRDDAVEILQRRQARRPAIAERQALGLFERRARADIGGQRPLNFGRIGRDLRRGPPDPALCPAAVTRRTDHAGRAGQRVLFVGRFLGRSMICPCLRHSFGPQTCRLL